MEKLSKPETESRIDLAELIKTLWRGRRTVILVAGAITVIGLLFAIFGEVKYTAGSVIVPQTGRNLPGGNIQGLAALAGINLAQSDQSGELLSPLIYPMVAGSVPFLKDLMYTLVPPGEGEAPVTLLDWFTDPAAYAGGGDEAPASGNGVEALTRREAACLEILARRLVVTVDEKDGYIALTATMPRPMMAALTAAKAQDLLQQYVTRFKLQKAQAGLDFIEARYAEVKADFESSQRSLAAFRDANRNITSAVAMIRETRLENEHDLAFTIYSELARQREQARIKVKEDTPVFTVVEPVTVPFRRSAPRRAFIMAVSVMLGLFGGMGVVFIRDYLPVLR
jgi:uncharacterized protein involved in exopolysaccharide biosynthesis